MGNIAHRLGRGSNIAITTIQEQIQHIAFHGDKSNSHIEQRVRTGRREVRDDAGGGPERREPRAQRRHVPADHQLAERLVLGQTLALQGIWGQG